MHVAQATSLRKLATALQRLDTSCVCLVEAAHAFEDALLAAVPTMHAAVVHKTCLTHQGLTIENAALSELDSVARHGMLTYGGSPRQVCAEDECADRVDIASHLAVIDKTSRSRAF